MIRYFCCEGTFKCFQTSNKIHARVLVVLCFNCYFASLWNCFTNPLFSASWYSSPVQISTYILSYEAVTVRISIAHIFLPFATYLLISSQLEYVSHFFLFWKLFWGLVRIHTYLMLSFCFFFFFVTKRCSTNEVKYCTNIFYTDCTDTVKVCREI